MNKTQTSETSESPLPHLEVLKKLRRLKPIDPSSLGVLGLFFVTVFLSLSCFFYVGYKAVDRGGFGFSGQQSQKLIFLGFRESGQGGDGVKRVWFLEDGGGGCDLFEGNWVWDESYPLYQERDCEVLDEGFRCSQNGRLDSFYTSGDGNLKIATYQGARIGGPMEIVTWRLCQSWVCHWCYANVGSTQISQ